MYIGDPVLIFKSKIYDIVFKKLCERKYYLNKESLQAMETAIRESMEEILECKANVKIPLIDSDKKEDWDRALETRSCGDMWITAVKDIDGETIKVMMGDLTG